MKQSSKFRIKSRGKQNGQAAVFLLLAVGFFLLGGIGLAVDMSNLWMHRQSAQSAADAACTAAAMDLVADGGGATKAGGFTPGTSFKCSANSTFAPCQYAAFNGYAATGLTAGSASTEVSVDFPTSVPGVPTCSSTTPVCVTPAFPTSAFVRVTTTDRIQSFFVGLLSGNRTMDVGAMASCGAVLANAPIPLLVLDPRNESSVSNNGNFTIQIVGGPQRSVQVNAASTSAVNISGVSGTFDLSKGGPGGTGSDFGVTGTEGATNYNGGTTGTWKEPTPPIADPFATLAYPSTVPGAPTVPANVAAAVPSCKSIPCAVPSGTEGCQDAAGCLLYTAGHYTSDITSFRQTLIFDPGVYYMDGNLVADQQSCLRPGTGTGDGSGGTMFYFNGINTVNVSANAGTWGVCGTATAVPLTTVECITSGTGKTQLPANVIKQGGLLGNVLLGACRAPTGGGTNYGDPLGTSDPLGEQRAMLFFQDRSANIAGTKKAPQPSWGGGGSFGLSGVMYFHYCNSKDGAHLGTNCDTSAAFTDQLSLQGGSCSSTFVIGDIVTDQLAMGGTPCIEMDLNPNALFFVLKADLLQ